MWFLWLELLYNLWSSQAKLLFSKISESFLFGWVGVGGLKKTALFLCILALLLFKPKSRHQFFCFLQILLSNSTFESLENRPLVFIKLEEPWLKELSNAQQGLPQHPFPGNHIAILLWASEPSRVNIHPVYWLCHSSKQNCSFSKLHDQIYAQSPTSPHSCPPIHTHTHNINPSTGKMTA